jgi:hypothetical protein
MMSGVTHVTNGTSPTSRYINRLNHRDLPDYLRIIEGLELHPDTTRRFIPSIANVSTNEGHWEEIALDYAAVVDALDTAYARSPDLFGTLSGDCSVPICLVWDRPALRALAPSFRVVGETVYLPDDQAAGAPDLTRIKHERCRQCAFDSRCSGVCAAYARSFGLAALAPIDPREETQAVLTTTFV